METQRPEQPDSTVWIDPATGKPVPGAFLRPEMRPEDKIPGIRFGNRPTIFPIIEGRTPEGTRRQAFYMNGSDGQPMVGIREVPDRPAPEQQPDL